MDLFTRRNHGETPAVDHKAELEACFDKPTLDVDKILSHQKALHEAQSGYSRLWGFFGLSYASWVTLPRAVMHEMPDDWQKRMAICLEEFEEAFPNWHDGHNFTVSAKKGRRFVGLPEWLCNYRRPLTALINEIGRRPW